MMEQLQSIFIRPSRHIYSINDLGPPKITINNRDVIRKDTKLYNKINKRIQLSTFLNDPIQLTNQLIIYLHCNSGSRVQGLNYMRPIVQSGFPFAIFDFVGSGISEGQYVTLGINESDDIDTVVNYFKGFNSNMKIALWGRSMGAVAALLYSVEHPKMVDVGVYDSPFSSLKKLALDLGCQQTNLPKFMVEGFMKLFNSHLKQKTGLDMFKQLCINEIADKIGIPGLFLGSKNDKLIPFSHIQQLYSKYGGYKEIYYLDQDHHERRKPQTILFILKFLKKQLNQSGRMQKKSTSNLISFTSGVTGIKRDIKIKKHSHSQVDFRGSFDKTQKIQQIMTARNNDKQDNRQQRPTQKLRQQKRKFIKLTQTNHRKYQSSKQLPIRIQTLNKQKQNNGGIRLCKNSNTASNRTPLSQIRST